MTLAIVMLGGFIFHFFWEAKSQYTMIYVFFLVPYMVFGVKFLGEKLIFFTNWAKKKLARVQY